MRALVSCLLALLLLAPAGLAQAQRPSRDTPDREGTRRQLVREEQAARAAAQAWAAPRHLPVRIRQPDGRLLQVVDVVEGRPRFRTSLSRLSAQVTRTDLLYPGQRLGLALTGRGLPLGVWDGGSVLTTHQEFGGRVRRGDGGLPDDHATHVGGTLAAAGVRTDARGMAYEATLASFDWDDDTVEMHDEAGRGLLVSNHSYGLVAGWHYGDLEGAGERWYWLGDPAVSLDEDDRFGWYDTEAARYDLLTLNNPYYLPVVAAGNDRADRGPTEGTYRVYERGAWRTYDVATRPLPPDGGHLGFDTIAGAALAKNVLTVGAIGFDGGAAQARVSRFSSFGPTDDGRVKPEVVALGENVVSATAQGASRYEAYSGTSMATPNVAGTLLLLQQLAIAQAGSPLRAASLKALVLHTATDLDLPGPDYRTGWGLLQAEAAALHLLRRPAEPLALLEHTLESGQTWTQSVLVAGPGPVRVTLAWTDRPSAPLARYGPASLDDPTPHLRSDLDVRLVHTASGTTYLPFKLDPTRPEQAARPGDNHVDPVEQIVLLDAPPGAYTLVVSHKSALPLSQPFSLATTGLQQTDALFVLGPVEAAASPDAVTLVWETLSERRPGTLVVERAPVRFPDGQKAVGAYVEVARLPLTGAPQTPTHYTYRDGRLPAGSYRYRLVVEAGGARYAATVHDVVVPPPDAFAVLSVYPNPARDRTTVLLDLPTAAAVRLAAFDVLGRHVTLVHDGPLPAGRHERTVETGAWAPGVYFIRVAAGARVATQRLVVR